MKKKGFLMLSCIAAVAIATFVGKKTFESKSIDCDALFAQNVEALSKNEESGGAISTCSGSSTWGITFIEEGDFSRWEHDFSRDDESESGYDSEYTMTVEICLADGSGPNTGSNSQYYITKEEKCGSEECVDNCKYDWRRDLEGYVRKIQNKNH